MASAQLRSAALLRLQPAPDNLGHELTLLRQVGADLEISGTPKAYSVRASSGKLATRSFCLDCGTPLFTQSEANPQFTSIRFPSLDDPSGFAPMLDIWTSSAQRWVCFDQKLPHFAESPPHPA